VSAAALLLSALAVAAPARAGAASTAAASTTAASTTATAPAGRVYIGVFLHDITKFNQKDGVFDVDLEVWAKWSGDFDPKKIVLANAAATERQDLGREKDGSWSSKRWRVRGTLRGQFPLRRFPFDQPNITVEFELPEIEGQLVPDLASSGMAKRFSITDWLYDPEFKPLVSRRSYSSDMGRLITEGKPTSARRVGFSVTLRRPIVMALLKLFLPLAIIALVALIALFLHPQLIDSRSAIGITALLSCFAFQYTVSDSLPDVAYLTLADKLFFLAYMVSSAALVVSVAAHSMFRTNHLGGARWLDRVFRVLLPAASVAVVLLVLPADEPAPAPRSDPLPAMQRNASARETLHIGTTLLTSIWSTPAWQATSWSLIREQPDGAKLPLFVTQEPRVDSDALRFPAGGGLEVTWRLRPGVKWSDGAPLTATDLAFTYGLSPDEQIRELRVIDPRTMVVCWKERLSRALTSIWPQSKRALGPAAVGPDAAARYKAVRKVRRTKPTPTLGPYHIVDYVAKQRVVAEANPNFPGPAPAIRRVVTTFYKDREKVVRDFKAGKIDIIVPNSVTMEQARALATERPDAVHIRPSALHIFLQPDLSHPLLRKLEVRRALLMAIDRAALARAVYGDAGRVAQLPYPAARLPDGFTKVRHNPAAAKALLERAGAAEASFTLLARKSPTNTKIVKLLTADLERVGLTLKLSPIKSSLKQWRKRTHGGLLLHVLRGYRDAAPLRYWNVPSKGGRFDAAARTPAYDATIQELVDRERRALFPERREQLRDALFVAASRHLPTLPLIFAAERVLADPALKSWDVGPNAAFGAGMESWYFVK
jgi:peptide/nickel transport system substrate-binding protein